MKQNKKITLIGILMPILMLAFIYRDFIFGEKYYIYRNDIASDDYYQFWPYIQHFHSYIRLENFPQWSFNEGLGNTIFPFPGFFNDPFILILLFLPKIFLLKGLVWMQVIKVFLAFSLFFLYLKKINLSNIASYFGAVIYAFSGHIIFRGSWYSYSTEAFALAFLMLSCELFYVNKKWWVLILGLLSVSFVSITSFYVYFIMTSIYFLSRWYFDRTNSRLKFSSLLLKLLSVYIFTVLLSCWQLLPGLKAIFESPRTIGPDSFFEDLFSNPFVYNNALINLTSFLRFFSTDIMGRAENYTGFFNSLSGPLFYCGLLSLVILFQPLFIKNRYRNLLIFFMGLVVLYIIYPYFRYFLNGFSGKFYKISNLWVITFFVVNAAIAFDLSFVKSKAKVAPYLVSFIIFFVPLLVLHSKFPEYFYSKSYKLVILFLVFYYLISLSLNYLNLKKVGPLLLIALTCLEMATFSSISVNKRDTLNNEIFRQHVEYNDFSLDALNWINQHDSGFFRVDKSYNSVYLDDALSQNYFGTKVYTSMNNPSYVKFVKAMEFPFANPPWTSYIGGFYGEEYINSVLGVKYILRKGDPIKISGYDFIKTFGDVHLYINNNYLPLGFVYESCISRSVFNNLNVEQKRKILTYHCILEDKDYSDFAPKVLRINKEDIDSEIVASEEHLRNFRLHNAFLKSGKLGGDAFLIAKNNDPQLSFDISDEAEGKFEMELEIEKGRGVGTYPNAQLFYRSHDSIFSQDNSVRFSLLPNTQTYKVSFYAKAIAFRLDFSDQEGEFRIKSIRLKKILSDGFYENIFPMKVRQLKANSMKLSSFRHNEINGVIDIKRPGIMFFSIPFNSGWKIYVDGIAQPIKLVNIGMLGVRVNEGHHNIHLEFKLPYLQVGFLISLLSLILLLSYYFLIKKDCES